MKVHRKHKGHITKYPFKAISLLILFAGLLQFCGSEEDPDLPEQLSVELLAQDVTVFRGSDGSIEAVVTGGEPPFIYSWSNGETSSSIDGLKAGFYSVTIKDAADSTAADSIEINQPIPDNTVTDIEGNIYLTVDIGQQTWMQENLRVSVAPDSTDITSYLYNDNEANEETFGRLYPWDVAMNGSHEEMARGICPVGWHIPSDGEWKTLEMFLGMTGEEADMINTWRGSGVGTKLGQGGSSGYEALFAGRRTSYGTYSLLNQYEYVWTSTEYGDYAWRRCLESGVSTVGRWNTFPKTYAFSIRCVKDN